MSVEVYEKQIKKLKEKLADNNDPNVEAVQGIFDENLKAHVLNIVNKQSHLNKSEIVPFIKIVSCAGAALATMSLPHEVFSVQSFDENLFYFSKAADPTSITAKPQMPMSVRPSMTLSNLVDASEAELGQHLYDLSCVICEDTCINVLKEITQHNKIIKKLNTDTDLLEAIEEESEEMLSKIGRSSNFVIMPMHFAKVIQNHIKTYYDFEALPINFKPIGVLKNRWKVYITSMIKNKMIIGYRGHHPVDAGLVFSPETFFGNPRKSSRGIEVSWMGRMETVRPDYFRTIDVRIPKANKNLDAIDDL